jgi:hypothetical protein
MPQSGFEDGFTVTTGGSLDTWVKELHAKVPGAIEEYIYDQLKLVIKDFFQRTKAWTTFTGPHTIAANDGTLCLNPIDAYSNVIMVLGVIRNGSALSQIDVRAAPNLIVSGNSVNNPSRYYLDPYHTIKLWPVPSADVENVYVTVALTPRLRSDNRIAEWIVDQHFEAIKAGALQRLYEEPDKSYSNVAKAEYWGMKYRSELTRSRSVAMQGYGETSQPWSFPRWNS